MTKEVTQNAIYKYEIFAQEHQTLEMPEGSEWLHVGVQNGDIKLWAQCPINNNMITRHIRVVGTGWIWDDHNLSYIGSVQIGGYVWHVYGD